MAGIQLLKACANSKSVLSDRWYLPIELIWMGTYLQQSRHDVEILDDQLLSPDEMGKQLRAPVVGIGFNIYSAESAGDLARAAKEAGALVIVGGQAATQLATQLLRENESIDAVVRYDGEEALRRIADAIDAGCDPFSDTPNLVYRRDGQIIANPLEQVAVRDVPIPDRRLKGIDIEHYIANFATTNTSRSFSGRRVTNAHTKKGCPRNCSFCGRTDKTHRARSAQQVFDEYRYLADDFAVDYIFDHSDTWAVDPVWLEEFLLVYRREGGLDARLSVFADLRDMSTRAIEILRAVGVDTIVTGVESGNETVLQENRKHSRRTEIIERVMAVTNAGIKVEASYILGCLGETRESVRETLDLSRELRDRSLRISNYFTVTFPLPGTTIWQRLMHDPQMQEKYGHRYAFDIEQLRRDYLIRHCALGEDGYEFLVSEREKILGENNLPILEYAR